MFSQNVFFLFVLAALGLHCCGLSLVAASGGYSLLRCAGFSLLWLLLLQSTGSRCVGFSNCSMRAQQLWHAGPRAHRLQQLRCVGSVVAAHGFQGARASVVVACGLQSAGSVVAAHGLSCSVACGIFLDQGSNPRPLHWKADS